MYGLTLPHRLNVETALLPVRAEPEIRLKAAQCCLCYCQNLINQLSWFYYKKAHFGHTEAIESPLILGCIHSF